MANPNNPHKPITRKLVGASALDFPADPTTPNILLNVPLNGTDVGIWDRPLNANASIIDGRFGAVTPVAVTNANITLTEPSATTPAPTQSDAMVLSLTGTPTASLTVTLPLPGFYIIDAVGLAIAPNTFVVLLASIAPGEVVGVQPGGIFHIYNDGINVRLINLPPIGTYLDMAVTAVPLWITATTRKYWLNCDGSAVPADCPQLSGLIGPTLPDFRGTFPVFSGQGVDRNSPAGDGINTEALFAITGTNGFSLTPNNIPEFGMNGNNNITVTVAGEQPGNQGTFAVFQQGQAAALQSDVPEVVGAVTGTNAAAGINFFTALAGLNAIAVSGGNAVPQIIPNAPVATTSGIRLIRAA